MSVTFECHSLLAMDEHQLRQLERQHKLRVKTGCETCRARRVKCDETKPECLRCTKTGRKCEGYKHVNTARHVSPSTAASYRNSAFLVVPQKPTSPSIPKPPTRSLSPDAMENRSFYFFQTHTLPKWTEFFDSDLWSQKIMQLSHTEPAIKHGILALSTMHERFENTSPVFTSTSNDFAFVQYSRAVKHSNDLLRAHSQGRVDVEKVLIACIIFTCYENLAGNYRAANMHLRNGLRILNQHKRGVAPEAPTESQGSIGDVLYRFDLQAMTFSDNTSPYEYGFDNPPDVPQIPAIYTTNSDARNDLVALMRCMMWVSGIANINLNATDNPIWLRIYMQVVTLFDPWERAFDLYQRSMPPHEQGDPKIYAGNTLLKMSLIMTRIIIAAGAGSRTEMAWDTFKDSFKTIVDLAETLPVLTAHLPPVSPEASTPPSGNSTPQPPSSRHRSIAPNPATPSVPSPTGSASTTVFSPNTSPTAPLATSPSDTASYPVSKRKPASFSPSFELSPIVPLFVTACRCRDPVLRRRAITILMNCRRREGVWDSVGAAMVALQCIKLEEGMDPGIELGADHWLPITTKCRDSSSVEERKRVQDVFVSVNMADRQIGVNYLMRSGDAFDRYVKF
ncbi:hypothetical protein BU23DRAFT_227505 [Bimuria novae-zelandiae CBS 107.79]|uniref:Zn(2)-C6 fungal-type domain-containing protein n=1 Tax=Bimuria novae-zelandiae CBS 107.79 TaxID=1447943 RepID=A0A6A5VZI6_9PLEO|nr:hypothetical protein BU23DRAFT_227505 [Bimuria novae-zelandiae CBS 107.79]